MKEEIVTGAVQLEQKRFSKTEKPSQRKQQRSQSFKIQKIMGLGIDRTCTIHLFASQLSDDRLLLTQPASRSGRKSGLHRLCLLPGSPMTSISTAEMAYCERTSSQHMKFHIARRLIKLTLFNQARQAHAQCIQLGKHMNYRTQRADTTAHLN